MVHLFQRLFIQSLLNVIKSIIQSFYQINMNKGVKSNLRQNIPFNYINLYLSTNINVLFLLGFM